MVIDMTERPASSVTAPTGSQTDPATRTVAVVIPAYTMKRGELLKKGVDAARAQTVPVQEIVICIDNNDQLLDRA